MSINIPSHYPDLESCSRTSIGNSPTKVHNRRYNVKKTESIQDHYANQSNQYYDESQDSNYRSRPTVISGQNDTRSKYRYKSYDYLPAKYGSCDQYNGSRYTNKEVGHDSLGHVDYVPDYNHSKPSRRHTMAAPRQYSSNEELENSNVNDLSSDYSHKNSYKSSNQNYGTCLENSPHKDYNNSDDILNSRKIYNTKSYYKPSSQQPPKRTSFSNNYSNSGDKSRSNNLTKIVSTPGLHSDEINYSHNIDGNNDNYTKYCDEFHNKNPMSLKSTYRKDENIPHSGTRLEFHRKQMDKFCRGNLKSGDMNCRFNESNNCDRISQYNTKVVHKPSGVSKCSLPTPPKHNHHSKTCSAEKSPLKEHRHNNPRSQKTSNQSCEGLSDNESCYFDSCRNSNNDYVSKQPDDEGYYNDSISDHGNSSTAPLSDIKPNGNLPISLASPKLSTNPKPQIPLQSQDTKATNYPSQRNTCRHSCRSLRHQSSHRHN